MPNQENNFRVEFHVGKTIDAVAMLIILMLSLLVPSTPAKADVYEYHPSSSMHLGGGFDRAHPTSPYVRPCLEYSDEKNIDSNGGVANATYTLQVISNRQQLYKSMHLSASADASYGFFSASGSVDALNDFSSSQDSITWTAEAELTFGRFQPVGAKPKKDIESESAVNIRAICGTELVTQETRGVVATIMYTFRNISSAQKNALSTAISASADFTSGSASVNSSYKEAVEQASKNSELSIKVIVRGGPGKEALASIIAADSDLSQIRAALQTYIANSTEKNAAAFQYETGNTSQFYPKVGNPDLTSGRDQALVSMYSSYEDLSAVVDRIQGLTLVPVKPEDEYLTTFVSSAKRTQLGSLAKRYVEAMIDIRKQATKCLTDDASCRPYDESALPRPNWPNIPPIPEIVVQRWCVMSKLFHTGHTFQSGEVVGDISWNALLEGESDLLDRLVVVDNGNPTPAAVLPMKANTGSSLPPFPGEDCKDYDPDIAKAFGRFRASTEIRNQMPISVTFEVHDRLGRVSYFHPPTPPGH